MADDGSTLLTSEAVGDLLASAVSHAGGTLLAWDLENVDANPGHSTTATYAASVRWPYGVREELLGVSARAGGATKSDSRAHIFVDGDREVAVWVYPKDPDLPGLPRAAYPNTIADVFNENRILPYTVEPDEVYLEMIGYRPRRRAVLKIGIGDPPLEYFVKVLRPRTFREVKRRHELLLAHDIPVPKIGAATHDSLLVLEKLRGRPLAHAIFDPYDPCQAEDLINLLDSMPDSVCTLDRRPPWTEAVGHYGRLVAAGMPELTTRLQWMVREITQGLAGIPQGSEPTHGDFHEGQIHVRGGKIVGLLDVDTIGPGRRADDLACLIAHLSTIQKMSAGQTTRVRQLIRSWVPVFDSRVDPTELRLRTAAVIISLATGPYRNQEPGWRQDTLEMVDSAEMLIRQVR